MSRKVLVVDDEKLIVKGLRFSLEQDGMEVDCAYDGEEALEKAKAGEYDIILLDPVIGHDRRHKILFFILFAWIHIIINLSCYILFCSKKFYQFHCRFLS